MNKMFLQSSTIKLDVEGFEAGILNAMQPLLESHLPDLLIEVLPEFADAIHSVSVSKLSKLGYIAYAINTDGLDRQDQISAGSCRDWLLTANSD